MYKKSKPKSDYHKSEGSVWTIFAPEFVRYACILIDIFPDSLRPRGRGQRHNLRLGCDIFREARRLHLRHSRSLHFLDEKIEERGIASPKNLSAVVPGLNIPDYGTSMTSTIYVRGLGSRMDNPVIGLYVDDVPLLDKNCYDFSFADIRSLEFLRGPQGTLYGRNSMLGVLSVETLSPAVYQGTRASIEYGGAATMSAKVSFYKGKLGLAATCSHSNGFYVNEYDDSHCGLSDAASLRVVHVGKVGRAAYDNILTISFTDQIGYPYRLWLPDEKRLLPIDYNDKSGYKRLTVMDGLRLKADLGSWKLSSVTSIQMLSIQ